MAYITPDLTLIGRASGLVLGAASNNQLARDRAGAAELLCTDPSPDTCPFNAGASTEW